MTPTTPPKSPVDTIKDYMQHKRECDPGSFTCTCGLEDALGLANEMDAALSSLSTQPAQTDEQLYKQAMEEVSPEALARMDAKMAAIDAQTEGLEPVGWMLIREDPLDPSLFTEREMLRRVELRRNKREEFIPLFARSLPRQKGEVEAITLQGEQSDPCGTITVMVKMSDGREVEAIRTCANSIYHMVSLDDPAFLPK